MAPTVPAAHDLRGEALHLFRRSRNYTADVDPKAFAVVNGKLYLNYSTDVQTRWRVDRDGNITKAEGNWPALLAKAPKTSPGGR